MTIGYRAGAVKVRIEADYPSGYIWTAKRGAHVITGWADSIVQARRDAREEARDLNRRPRVRGRFYAIAA